MSAAATAGERQALYAALRRRNRCIGLLRFGVPAAGIVVLALFAGQIFLAGLKNQFGIGNVSFAGNTVTVDTPSYSGVMENGDAYTVAAERARTAISVPDVINLENFRMVLTKPEGKTLTATATSGAFKTSTQVMTVPGTATVADAEGNTGTMSQVTVSLPAQSLRALGPVVITTADGTTIAAPGLDYEAASGRWNFIGRTTVTVPHLPGDEDMETSR